MVSVTFPFDSDYAGGPSLVALLCSLSLHVPAIAPCVNAGSVRLWVEVSGKREITTPSVFSELSVCTQNAVEDIWNLSAYERLGGRTLGAAVFGRDDCCTAAPTVGAPRPGPGAKNIMPTFAS